METERIQKILSELGVCSRRKAEEYISQGRVKVNGEIISLGFKCTMEDEIMLDDKIVSQKMDSKKVYLAFNKPYDVVSTLSDPQGRKTVADYIPMECGRLFPVGRLDHNSTGLLIMTNDGEFANLITHPSSAPEKEYVVKVKNPLKGDEVERLSKGLYVMKEGYTAAPCEAKVIKEEEDNVIFDMILHEGKKREIRYMMDTLDHPVRMLMRIRIGNILLGRLPSGQFREIPVEEIEALKAECQKNQLESFKNEKYYGNYDKEE
jgi:23S rRNA pseudouridine2605 synthase